MGCNMKVVTSLTHEQVVTFVNDNRLVGCSVCNVAEEPILTYVANYMKQMTGYSGIPLPCVSKIDGKDASLDLGVECYMPMLNIKSGNFLLQLDTCNDAAGSIELSDYMDLAARFKRASDPDELEELAEELFDSMQLGEMTSGSNVLSFIPFIDGSALKCFTVLETDWSQKNQSIGYGVEAIKAKLMQLN